MNGLPTIASTPALLEELRNHNRVVDWRRAKVFPEAAAWRQRFLLDSSDWNEEQRLEAQALLAKAYAQPLEAAEFLLNLAVSAKSRVSWVREELRRIFSTWEKLETFGFRDRASDLSIYQLKLSIIRILRLFPKDRVFHECMAVFLAKEEGLASALEHLEGALNHGAPIGDLLASLINRSLNSPKNATIIRFVADLSPWMQSALGLSWPALALNRSITFASLLVMQPRPMWLDLINPKALTLHSDFAKTLDSILAELGHNGESLLSRTLKRLDLRHSLDGNKKTASAFQVLRRLADVHAFWVSALPGAEEAREKLLSAMFSQLERGGQQSDRLKVLLALHKCVPKTVSFWSNPEYRQAVSRRILALCDDLPAPYTSMIKARFFFSLEDYDSARTAFGNYAEESPETKGVATYLDFTSVKNLMSLTGNNDFGSWPRVEYETLQQGEVSKEPVIIIAANDRYYNLYLEKYLIKLSKLTASGRIHMHLFGKPDLTRVLIKHLARVIPQYQISFSHEKLVVDQPYFFASGRFLRIGEWTRFFRSPVIMTDIDNLWGQGVAGSPGLFMEKTLSDADVGLDLRSRVVIGPLTNSPIAGNRYPSATPWSAVWAGKVFLKGNEKSDHFAEIVSRLTSQQLHHASGRKPSRNWFIDQSILCAAYSYALRYCPSIKFVDLSDHPSGKGLHWLSKPDKLGNHLGRLES